MKYLISACAFVYPRDSTKFETCIYFIYKPKILRLFRRNNTPKNSLPSWLSSQSDCTELACLLLRSDITYFVCKQKEGSLATLDNNSLFCGEHPQTKMSCRLIMVVKF